MSPRPADFDPAIHKTLLTTQTHRIRRIQDNFYQEKSEQENHDVTRKLHSAGILCYLFFFQAFLTVRAPEQSYF